MCVCICVPACMYACVFVYEIWRETETEGNLNKYLQIKKNKTCNNLTFFSGLLALKNKLLRARVLRLRHLPSGMGIGQCMTETSCEKVCNSFN